MATTLKAVGKSDLRHSINASHSSVTHSSTQMPQTPKELQIQTEAEAREEITRSNG